MEEYSKKKRAILIAAGSFYGLPFSVSEEDLVIAVDGGMRYCKEEGLKPQILLGDFDSYSPRGAEVSSAKPVEFLGDTARDSPIRKFCFPKSKTIQTFTRQ